MTMKTIYVAFLIAVCAILAAALSGCSAEKYGAAVDQSISTVKVKDVFLNNDLVGSPVTLEGKISSQCGSNGCWFVLQDDTGQVFIILHRTR